MLLPLATDMIFYMTTTLYCGILENRFRFEKESCTLFSVRNEKWRQKAGSFCADSLWVWLTVMFFLNHLYVTDEVRILVKHDLCSLMRHCSNEEDNHWHCTDLLTLQCFFNKDRPSLDKRRIFCNHFHLASSIISCSVQVFLLYQPLASGSKFGCENEFNFT